MKRLLVLLAVCMTFYVAVPAQAADDFDPYKWSGEFCSERHCLNIANIGEGPENWYFSFIFFEAETAVGDGMAAMEGDAADYAALRFSLQKNGEFITVTFVPDERLGKEFDWMKNCPGVYTARP